MVAVKESLTWRITRVVLLVVFGVYLVSPLVAMLDFSTRNIGGTGRTWDAWVTLVQDEDVRSAIIASLLLAVFTVAAMLLLLVPTMIWAKLRVPKASRLLEFLCLLPLAIPPLVVVVGISGVYAWVSYLLGDSALTLTFAYVVLVLPYAYRVDRLRALRDQRRHAVGGGEVPRRGLVHA